MRKLRLDVDALKVHSFSPEPAPAARRGTVKGNAIVAPYPTGEYSMCFICPNTYDTCGFTENNTCIRTIRQSCVCTTQTLPDTNAC